MKSLLKVEWETVKTCLETVQRLLLESNQGFAQVCGKEGLDVEVFTNAWKKSDSSKPTVSPFPVSRQVYQLSDIDATFGASVLVPISGLATSFVNITVPCSVDSIDHAAVLVLCEVFSRIEGPLYTRIRGKGFAYGVSMHLSWWYGQLLFDCSEVSDPYAAVHAFWDVLEEYTFNSFDVETAKAGVLFGLIEQKSTVGGLLHSALKSVLKVCILLDVN